MKNESAFAKKFTSLFKRIKKGKHTEIPVQPDPISQLIMGFLQWNTTNRFANAAYNRLTNVVVDHNDLRVSHLHEVINVIGVKYAQVEERVQRLLTALQEIYIREHAVTLDHLSKKSKKDVRAYLESIPTMPPYVASQVILLSFSGHAIPVDDVLAYRLREENVVAPDATVEQISSFLERQIRAADAVDAHAILRAWTESGPHRRVVATKPTRSVVKRAKTTTTKKKTSKTTTKTVKSSVKKKSKTTKKKTPKRAALAKR